MPFVGGGSIVSRQAVCVLRGYLQSLVLALAHTCLLSHVIVANLSGGSAAADPAATSSLRHIAPQIQHPDAAQESWEQAASGDAADADVSDRLTQLTHVVWPAIPERLQLRLASQCPKLQINIYKDSAPSARKVQDSSSNNAECHVHWTCMSSRTISCCAAQVPPEANPSVALDALFLDSWGLLPSHPMAHETVTGPATAQQAVPPLSIAERFRIAYEERDQQDTAKAMKVHCGNEAKS